MQEMVVFGSNFGANQQRQASTHAWPKLIADRAPIPSLPGLKSGQAHKAQHHDNNDDAVQENEGRLELRADGFPQNERG